MLRTIQIVVALDDDLATEQQAVDYIVDWALSEGSAAVAEYATVIDETDGAWEDHDLVEYEEDAS